MTDLEAKQCWAWVNDDEKRRRIRKNTISNQWEWVDQAGKYHVAPENSFSGAVLDALRHDPT
jgi:hypothetical protein